VKSLSTTILHSSLSIERESGTLSTRGQTYPLFEDIISHHYHGKKDMYIYPISFDKNFASIVTVSEQRKAIPGSTAAHKSLTFYQIELKSDISARTARKWQITAEMAETAVLKEKYCL
jgi:hypothetical protein